jgi:glyoxylase I family protein
VNLQIEHLGLPAREPVALKDWYVRVLGARVVFDNGETPPAFLLALRGGGALLEIYAAERALPDTAQNRLAGWRHVALRVDSIDAARTALESRGVVFSEPVKPAGGGGRVLFFADAEGNLLHFVERPENWPAGLTPA